MNVAVRMCMRVYARVDACVCVRVRVHVRVHGWVGMGGWVGGRVRRRVCMGKKEIESREHGKNKPGIRQWRMMES